MRKLAILVVLLSSWAATGCCQSTKYPLVKVEKWRGRLYLFDTTHKYWSQAAATCQRIHGDLVEPTDKDTLDFIVSSLKALTGLHDMTVWTGLRQHVRGVWKWESGKAVNFTNWEGKPSSLKGDCAFVKTLTGDWEQSPCEQTKRMYVCLLDRWTTSRPETTTHIPQFRKARTEIWRGWQYEFVPVAKNWSTAGAYCKEKGGLLLEISDKDTLGFIGGKLKEFAVSKTALSWIGLRQDNDSTWHWESGREVSFTSWINKPSKTEQNCAVVVNSFFHRQFWVPNHCDSKIPFVCQIARSRSDLTNGDNPEKPTTETPKYPVAKVQKWRGRQYLFNTLPVFWSDAATTCQRVHGSLVEPEDNDTLRFIVSTFRTFTGLEDLTFWIGLRRHVHGGWKWESGKAVNLTTLTSKPPSLSRRDCSFVKTLTGDWEQSPCEQTKRMYVCVLEPWTTSRPKTTTRSPLSARTWTFREWQYVYVPERRDWFSAKTECHKRNGKLAETNDQNFHVTANQIRRLYGTHLGFWIGLNKNDDGQWLWESGKTVQPQWRKHARIQFQGECGYADFFSGLLTIPCESKMWFICKIANPSTTARRRINSTHKATIARWWTEVWQGKRFVFVSLVQNWTLAEADCRQRGGALAAITDNKTQAFIDRKFVALQTSQWIFWIGLRENTNLLWQSGDKVTFTNWNGPGEMPQTRCAVMVMHTNSWMSMPCSYKLPYLCQVRE